MKSERNSDDLWTQRTLSTFQTFARGQDQKGGQQNSALVPSPGVIRSTTGLSLSTYAPSTINADNGLNEANKYLEIGNEVGFPNRNGYHSSHHSNQKQQIHWNDSPPPPPPPLPHARVGNGNGHASLSPTSSSSSSESPKTSSSNGSIYRYIENDNQNNKSGNISITHVNGGGMIGRNGHINENDYHNNHYPPPHCNYLGQSNNNTAKRTRHANDATKVISKPIPVAVPKLQTSTNNSNRSSINSSIGGASTHTNHKRSRSIEGHQYNEGTLPNGNVLVIPPSSFSAPYPAHCNSNTLPYAPMDTEPNGYYMPSQEDEQILQIICAMAGSDKRFGFSVIGGREEGFPPCIDEVTPGSPADKADLEVGDEILEVNGRSLEDATHTEVISHIHQCIRSRTICLRVKRRSGNKLALDLASQSNVQDAFVIAVEQQARERLEKLSALKKIKPVDMTKLSQQLSETPSESGETSAELNGLIEAATGSPIYVTSASELNSSQSALHRTVASSDAAVTGVCEESQEEEIIGKPSPARSTPTSSTVTTRAVISSSGPDLSPSKRSSNNVTVVGVNSTSGSTTTEGTCLPNGQYSSGAGERSTTSSLGEPVLPAKKSISKESVNGSRKSGSRESITGSRESVQFEGAKPSPSRSRGSASKLASQSSSRESVIEASTSSQYANMINMVDVWDNGPHREMAVDVPESFVPRNKTPPRYPPTNKTTTLNSNNNKTAGKSVVSDGVGVRGNGTATLPGQNGAAGKPVPPPRIGDKEGVYGVNNNTTQVPHVTPRTVVGQQAKTATTTPSRDEAERIRKYQEELKKRREQEEKHAKEEEFLRTSLRGSKKLQALESVREDGKAFPTGDPKGFVNHAYDMDGDRISHPSHDITLQKPVGLPELVASLQRVQQALKKHGVQLDEAVSAVGTLGSLMQTQEFQQVLAVHTKVQDVWCFNAPPAPATSHAQQLNQECLESLYNCSSPASAELVDILSRIDMDGVLHAHDKIAERERLLMTAESPMNVGESVDPVLPSSSTTPAPPPAMPAAPVVGSSSSSSHMKSVPRPAFVPEPLPDDHIKVVRIEKTQDPLGATVRNDGDAVVIGRVVKGGAAERSGLLHEGDEILEVNGVEMRGKTVNEVCDILSRMNGTLTFLIVPTQVPPPPLQQRREILVHVRAHFDYDPEDDIYIPCRELGVAFAKGDVLHVINQEDPNWWQAHREGEEDQQLAGLIPSKSFQEQREAVKQTLLGETETREKTKKATLLCAKTHKKKKKKIPYSSAFNDEFDAEEIPTYEEVALYYPRTSFKRPVVLIGPPNIGRHELRQRLMQESDRFAAAVPHTSRSRKDGEIDGQDYHFISRAQFESDILSRKFVEHGEFEKAYYGTSLDAIRSVVNASRICVLNLHPQSLKILRSSDLKPYIVFIAPPPLERLKQMRIARGEAYKEDELIDIIEKAREMEEKYGHYFDLVIVNNDIERTYHELVQRINYIEREPQWVPSYWLKQ